MLWWREKDRDSLVVPRKDWEDLQADVRGLKRLAELEERSRQAQNERFAAAIDELEKRILALGHGGDLATAAAARSTEALAQRIARVSERVALLEMGAASAIPVEGVVR